MAIRAGEWICGTVKGNGFNNLSIYLEFAVRRNKRCKSMWKALSKRHKGWRNLRKRKKTFGRDLNRWGSWSNKREEVLSTALWDKGGVKALWLTGGPKTGDIAYSHSMSQPCARDPVRERETGRVWRHSWQFGAIACESASNNKHQFHILLSHGCHAWSHLRGRYVRRNVAGDGANAQRQLLAERDGKVHGMKRILRKIRKWGSMRYDEVGWCSKNSLKRWRLEGSRRESRWRVT